MGGAVTLATTTCPNRKHSHAEDDSMDNASIREMAPAVADIKTLHRELARLLSGSRNRNRERGEKTSDTSDGTYLVIKGK